MNEVEIFKLKTQQAINNYIFDQDDNMTCCDVCGECFEDDRDYSHYNEDICEKCLEEAESNRETESCLYRSER